MEHSFLIYLLESSLCLLLFGAFFKLVLQKQTFYNWNRYYLIASLMFSVVIPLINIPVFSNSYNFALNIIPIQASEFSNLNTFENNNSNLAIATKLNVQQILFFVVLALYFVVALIKLIRFIRKLIYLKLLIVSNKKTKEQQYWIVTIENSLPAFSFFKYIFINKNLDKIDKNKFNLIKRHEAIHVNQQHSLDNIFLELLLILFWFNPIIYFFKKSIHETHEFIVDEQLTLETGNKKEYSHLLLNLAIQNVNISPFLGFSSIKINKRIQMLNKQKSKTMKKLLFAFMLPIIALSLVSFSFTQQQTENKPTTSEDSSSIEKLKVGKINWEGNTLYSDEELSKNLGLKSGDEYNHDTNHRLWGSTPVISMYMDNGHVFYNATFKESIHNGVVDISINIFEGNKGVIGIIDLTGNNKIPKQKILNKIKVKKGDFFNRTALTNSISAIQTIKGISADGNDIRVIPEQNKLSDEGYSIINLEFVVSEE